MPRLSPRSVPGREVWLPVLAAVVTSVAVIALWMSIETAEKRNVRLEQQVTAEQVRLRLEAWINVHTIVVAHLAQDREHPVARNPEQFRSAATHHLQFYPGLQALNWVDPSGVIQVVVPESGNRGALGADLNRHADPGVPTALARAIESDLTVRTPILELLQGGRGFAVYQTIRDDDGTLIGLVNGVFRVEQLVDACLAEESLRSRFAFRLSEIDGRTVYEHGPDAFETSESMATSLHVRAVDRDWILDLRPNAAMIASAYSAADEVLLVIGLLLGIVAGILLRRLLIRNGELRRSENLHRLLVENQTDMIVRLYADRRLDFVSPSYSRTFGESAQDLSEDPLTRFVDPADREALERALTRVERPPHSSHVEVRERTIRGLRWHCWLFNAVPDQSGRVRETIGVGRDVTARRQAESDRREMERQILHAQKLESLGILAGGIAHDFNNLLVSIRGNAELAQAPDLVPSLLHEHLEAIVSSSSRAADLCGQMLAYSGRGRFDVRSVDIAEVVQQIAALIEVSTSKKTDLELRFEDELPPVQVDATQLGQVVMNLITNAADAIGEQEGRISVRAGTVECDRDYLDECSRLAGTVQDEPLPTGHYVYLDVEDDGCGMDSETAERIFDPFFTSKFTGRGLGLAAVLGIVRGHQGAIHVKSRLGVGTRFRVLLPITDQPVERSRPLPGDPETDLGGTVLVVDDDPEVLRVASKALIGRGYSVVLAHDGREAVDRVRDDPDRIDCVLLDLTMPRMDGREALTELRRIRPELPVVLSSGYDESDIAERFVEERPDGFIQKPYGVATLAEGIRVALARRGHRGRQAQA